jgi:hypothetical protein
VIVVSYDLLAAVSSRESAVTPEETVAQSATGHETTPDEAPAPRPELSTTWEAPGTQTEQRLAAIWRELLGIDGIGRHDDFFELGGHSLLATRVLARVQDTLGARLTLREVFEAPTIHRMAGLVDRTGSAATDTSSEEKEEREEFEF